MPRDAVVVGSGPNGLAAAITLAQAGLDVEVREAAQTIGGGLRTEELTLPGFRHDVCASVLPLGAASPYLRELPLAEHGLQFLHAVSPLAHPLDDLPAVTLDRLRLGLDGDRWTKLFDRLAHEWPRIESSVLGPPLHLPRAPLAAARFAAVGALPCTSFARRFHGAEARSLLAGSAAHSILPLERAGTTGYALVLLALAHDVGWPVARGGSQSLADALATYLRSLGGELTTNAPVTSLGELDAPLVLLDVGPRQLVELAGGRLPLRYARALRRYRYGPGAFKLDYALAGPIPWTDPACASAGTVHLGGSLEEIAWSERAVWRGGHAERPFVILAQPTVADPSRAPDGKHVAWAYCHVQAGSTVDMSDRIEAQIERFAPGFHDLVLARSSRGPRELERSNPNLVAGDINGGAGTLRQLLARPVLSATPYRTPLRGIYLCSASTPPGGGVHGMCGHLAARAALRDRGRS